MKTNYFWSPHIDPQVATLKSVYNSLNSLAKFEKKFECKLINIFGEWDDYEFATIKKIELLSHRKLLKRKFKGFFNSRFLYFLIFINSYFPLKKILNQDKPDHLVVHLITSIPLLMFVLNKFETKLILRISGLPQLNFPRFLLWKLVSKKIKYVICPTEETKNFLLRKKIFTENQLKFIPDPILNINKINILKRETLDHEITKPFFLCIGRFTKQKNHIFLLNFFSKNNYYLENYKLVLIGEGELENEYRKIINNNSLKNKVQILGYKKNVFNYIKKANCVISSSLWEDPGFIMVESAFVGTPIITSDCPNGPKEFIGKNESGFIYKSNDVNSFQNELDSFLNISKDDLFKKKNKAKKRSRLFTGYYNYKKLSYLLN